MRARLVMMEGPAGAGKTTLANALARSLRPRADVLVDHAIFEREEFALVAKGYRTRVWPTAAQLLDAYGRTLDRARAGDQIVVADFSAVGLAEELPWAQPDRTSVTTNVAGARADAAVLAEHARAVGRLADQAILLALDVSIEESTRRAHAERGDERFTHFLQYVPPLTPQEKLVQRVIRHFESLVVRRDDIVRAHADGGWQVARIDATKVKSEVLRQALEALGRA